MGARRGPGAARAGASITSLWNGFAYDDGGIIEKNARAHSLSDFLNFFVTGYCPATLADRSTDPLLLRDLPFNGSPEAGSPSSSTQ
jgi:hypothetical protein